MSKRGASSVTILKYFGMAVSAIVIIMLFIYWREVKDNTFLERNYLARDISMLLSTAYASPGDLTYCYYNVGDYKGKFDYLIGNSKVTVVDRGKSFAKGGAVYFYAADKNALMPSCGQAEEPFTGCLIRDNFAQLEVLQIINDNSGVHIKPKKGGEDASPCKP